MNKPVYFGMSMLDISKTLMYKFCYDYIKPNYQDNARLCYMDTDSFIVYFKTKNVYEDFANDVEKWYDTSNYSENYKRPPPGGINKEVLGLMKDELGGNRICWK